MFGRRKREAAYSFPKPSSCAEMATMTEQVGAALTPGGPEFNPPKALAIAAVMETVSKDDFSCSAEEISAINNKMSSAKDKAGDAVAVQKAAIDAETAKLAAAQSALASANAALAARKTTTAAPLSTIMAVKATIEAVLSALATLNGVMDAARITDSTNTIDSAKAAIEAVTSALVALNRLLVSLEGRGAGARRRARAADKPNSCLEMALLAAEAVAAAEVAAALVGGGAADMARARLLTYTIMGGLATTDFDCSEAEAHLLSGNVSKDL
jgi:hypothetical protein